MTKKRDREYGPKPQDVELRREEIPQSPAKMRSGYCKKRKAEHEFELDEVMTFKHLGYPPDTPRQGPLYIKGFTDYKIYRCTACKKKKVEWVEQELDDPVLTREGQK